jgi:hypothetical protein
MGERAARHRFRVDWLGVGAALAAVAGLCDGRMGLHRASLSAPKFPPPYLPMPALRARRTHDPPKPGRTFAALDTPSSGGINIS